MRRPARTALVLAAVIVAAAVGITPQSSSAANSEQPTQREFVRRVVHSPLAHLLSGPARTGLRILTGRKGSSPGEPDGAAPSPRSQPVTEAAPTNVRVNDPSTDGAGHPDMTTENEVSVAVSGSNVVAGYNDDGTDPPPVGQAPSPATDLTGYSWSDDGGSTWHDADLPNRGPRINAGDPVVTSDRAGHFYFATLVVHFARQRLDVGVARSDDGGKTFHPPVRVSSRLPLTLNDKPWITVGPDPSNPSLDIVYVSWMESYFVTQTNEIGTRIMMAQSRDSGATWTQPHVVYTQPAFIRGTIKYVDGVALATDPTTGRLYVAWEQFIDPLHGRGLFLLRREQATSSFDGGQTFGRTALAASPGRIGDFQQICGDVLRFGEGKLVRVTEFPSLAVGPGGQAVMAFNSKDPSGNLTVQVARSLDGGLTWTSTDVPSAGGFMPAVSADTTGVSVVFYQRTPDRLVKAQVATSSDGVTYTVQDLSDVAFAVPYTLPMYDPMLAQCYMGDYVGVQRVAGTTYAGWGDNRDVIVNQFWPNGRPDPDVFFAKL